MPLKLRRECRRLRLTVREAELISLVIAGETFKRAADQMHCQLETVKFHSRNLKRKLRAQTMAQAVGILLLPQSAANQKPS
jgi:DNA-binding CsgD family transcriptional regulator